MDELRFLGIHPLGAVDICRKSHYNPSNIEKDERLMVPAGGALSAFTALLERIDKRSIQASPPPPHFCLENSCTD